MARNQPRRPPPHSREKYTGTTRTVEAMSKMASGKRGAQSLRVRMCVEDIVRWVQPRDYLSQLAAIYNWLMLNHGYLRDPIPSEMVKDPERTVKEIEEYGRFVGDCDCAATFLVGAARAIGIPSMPVRVGFRKPRQVGRGLGASVIQPPYTHVLAAARDQHGRTVVLDPVAADKTHQMLRRTRRYG